MKNDYLSGSTFLAIKSLDELLLFNKNKRKEIYEKTLKQMKGMYIFQNIKIMLENCNYTNICIKRIKEQIIREQNRIIKKALKIIKHYNNILTISNSSMVLNLLIPLKKNIFILKSSPENEGIIFFEKLKQSANTLYLIEDNEFETYYDFNCIFLCGCDGYFDNSIINKKGTSLIINYAFNNNRKFLILCDKYKKINNPEKIDIPENLEIISLRSCKNFDL